MSTTDAGRFAEGTVALVTGAGRGLGAEYATALAAAGATVAVHARTADAAGAVVARIRSGGGRAHPVTGDARDGRTLVDDTVGALGRLDVLVVNAGATRDRAVPRLTDDDWDTVVDVHLRGSWTACSAAWPHLRPRGGAIVLTTSGAGLHGNPGQAAYAAAKAGVLGLARTLAAEGRRFGIRVNAVAPMALTSMTEEVFRDRPAQALRAADVAPFVVALALPSCPLTGEVVETGGGWASVLRWERSHGIRLTGSDGRPPGPAEVAAHWAGVTDFAGRPPDHPTATADSLAAACDAARGTGATRPGTEACC
ncbi:SDR family NAD(P)-dependent oxidoreductase [Pseudonocardia alni]|uniref:SDR family NAD(P)-dependent oxidoreductase n=1 Tax=Pseudonocardia alni TaxID=33907 RepID=UPI001AD6B5EC|nr:SDR family NAD(P)-dependent oxidoreductase [Pseudonocardia alni]MBO4239402.1 SDR family NAD(P)-dependent oxidoreductase [Pseudonocardia alni]